MAFLATSTATDAVSSQLEDWEKQNQEGGPCRTTNPSGIALQSQDVSITAGLHGPMVMYDWDYFEELGHFHRERIPERVVHAKGAGAFGYFEVTDDVTHLTTSSVFAEVGKRTPIAVRFSRVTGNLGSADTDRDPRGFAVKFYTDEGIWDLVGNNTPIFFMRDPKLFPLFIHSQKRNPATNIRPDYNMFWDYLTLSAQSIHQTMILFSDRGTPLSYRHMHGYGSHTFSLINIANQVTYVKFHYKTDQGISNLGAAEAVRLAGQDSDYYVRDLYNAIGRGDFPTWTFYVQTMTPEEARVVAFDPFDVTKVWPQGDYPLRRVGRLVLNRNPVNYFAEVEQLAFKPSNITPGIGLSPDRLLQGRLFSYQDTHRYRLGVNCATAPPPSTARAAPPTTTPTASAGRRCLGGGTSATRKFPHTSLRISASTTTAKRTTSASRASSIGACSTTRGAPT